MRIVLESEMSKQDLWTIHEWIVLKGWTKDPDSPLGYIRDGGVSCHNYAQNCVMAMINEMQKELAEAARG